MLFVLAGASDAHAGQYTLAYDFAADLSGWSGYVEPGYALCGRGATAGCPDVSTNRIMARTGSAQAIWSQGRWEWTAPPGTLIVGGSLAYRTRMRHGQFFARVKMRADGVTWDAAPALVAEQQTTALTDHVISLASGFRQIGVALYAHPGVSGLVTDAWDDYITFGLRERAFGLVEQNMAFVQGFRYARESDWIRLDPVVWGSDWRKTGAERAR
jgi:hypothetical protein